MANRKKNESNRADGRVNMSFRFNGKVYSVTGKTKEEALLKKIERLEKLKNGEESRKNPTMNEYYGMFRDNRRSKVRGSTIRIQTSEYNDMAAVPIKGAGRTFGELRLKDVTAADVQQVQRALHEGGMSSETVNDCIAHLSHVFKRAILERIIDWNPCVAVDNLRRTEPKAKDTTHRALTEAETKSFFEAMSGSYYENICKLMIQTGMRVGEVGALMISDFDTKEGVIHVTKTISRREDGTYFVSDTPKTDSGNRDIPMTETVQQVFKSQLKLNTATFGRVEMDKPVFRAFGGDYLRGYSLNREIERKTKKLGIEHFTSHAFRATFATRFIEQRPEDYKILSELLGHSNIDITLNLYAAHKSKDRQRKAMDSVVIAM